MLGRIRTFNGESMALWRMQNCANHVIQRIFKQLDESTRRGWPSFKVVAEMAV